jgi:hypothetical protein
MDNEKEVVYFNYKCPLCGAILYKEETGRKYDNNSPVRTNKSCLVVNHKTHDCLANMSDIEQKVLYQLVSVSKYKLPFSNKF